MRLRVACLVLSACGRVGFDERAVGGDAPGADAANDAPPDSGPMAIQHRVSAKGTTVSQGFNVDCTLSIPQPAGAVAGDLLLGMIYTDGGANASIATPGFTRLALDGGTFVAFYKVVGAIEPAAYDFPIVAGIGAADTCASGGVVAAFTGVDPVQPIDTQSERVQSTEAQTVIAAGVTPSAATFLVGAFGSNGPAGGITPPASMTTDAASRAASPGDFGDATIAWQVLTSAAPTGDRTATIAGSRVSAAALVALNPL